MAILPQRQLLGLLLRAVDESGWQALVLDAKKPFNLRIFNSDEKGFDVRIYIWNCTHGGGSERAKDEYRIQFTGVVPTPYTGGITLLLGWHDGYGVFVGWDIARHSGQDSKSPSAQVKESALANAHANAFAVHRKNNGEIVVAFRPEFLVDYAMSTNSLHETGVTESDISLLDDLDGLTEETINSVDNVERKTVLAQIARKYRLQDFRRRVLGAYQHRCAACGVELELIDAAHILPVAASGSTDETTNGIALCKLHHAAFDRNLVGLDEKYRIEINEKEVTRLIKINRAGGLAEFRRYLKSAILLPADKRDYPNPKYIKAARAVRKWNG